MASRFARSALVSCALLTALVGCGQDETAGEPVPGLVQDLDRIDDSIAAGRYSRARAALDALVETASQARQAGDLDAARADEIAGAAARLRAALPAVRPGTPEATTPESTEPTEEPSYTPAPREDDEKEDDEKEHGKGHGKGHKDKDD